MHPVPGSDQNLILVARVAGAFGVKGEVRLTAYTADPLALLDYRDLKREDGSAGLTLLSGRPAKGGLVSRAKEVETREQAEALRGLRLFIPRDALPEPEEDEYYLVDLVGLSVLSGAHMSLFRRLTELLRERDAGDIVVFGGGIVPEEDLPALAEMGVAKIFTPGATTSEITGWVAEQFPEG